MSEIRNNRIVNDPDGGYGITIDPTWTRTPPSEADAHYWWRLRSNTTPLVAYVRLTMGELWVFRRGYTVTRLENVTGWWSGPLTPPPLPEEKP